MIDFIDFVSSCVDLILIGHHGFSLSFILLKQNLGETLDTHFFLWYHLFRFRLKLKLLGLGLFLFFFVSPKESCIQFCFANKIILHDYRKSQGYIITE